jgi:hypothetical protein
VPQRPISPRSGSPAAPFCRFEVGCDLDKEVRRLAIRRAVHVRIGSA